MKIDIRGFKNAFRSVDLGKLCFLMGPNGSGKSAIMDGIRWAITGNVPTGRSKGEVGMYTNPMTPHVMVRLEDEDKVLACASYITDMDGKVKVKQTADVEFNEPILTPRELITASPWARATWFWGSMQRGNLLLTTGLLLDEMEKVTAEMPHDLAVDALAVAGKIKEICLEVAEAHAKEHAKNAKDLEDSLYGLTSGDPYRCWEEIIRLADKIENCVDSEDNRARLLTCAEAIIRDKIQRMREKEMRSASIWKAISSAVRGQLMHHMVPDVEAVCAIANSMHKIGGISIGIDRSGIKFYQGARSLESMSSGEQTLYLAALSSAICRHTHGRGVKQVLIVEADPCDADNLQAVVSCVQVSGADLACVSTWQMPEVDEIGRMVENGWHVIAL